MVRDNRVSLGFNDDEYEKLNVRAKEAHLKLGDYIRWYIFKPVETTQQFDSRRYIQEVSLPYMASEEAIERIKAGEPVYIDPYQQAKLEAQKTFLESGSLGVLHNQLILKAKGGRILNSIPKKELKKIDKHKEERRHVANKHLEVIKQKNIDAGILNNE